MAALTHLKHPGLSPTDVDAILEIVVDLGRAADQAELISTALERLDGLVPSTFLSYNWITPGQVTAVVHPERSPEVRARLHPLLADHFTENPLIEHFRRTADSRARTWDDVCDVAVWYETDLYRSYYGPLGITDQLAVRLPGPPDGVSGLALSRDRAFTERDRQLVTLLGRYVVVQMESVTELDAYRSALRQRGWHTIPVDNEARVVRPGGVALDGAQELTGLALTHGDPLPSALAEVVALRPRVAGQGPGPVVECDLAPVPLAAFVVSSSHPPHLLFVRPHEQLGVAITDTGPLVARGLSVREAEVALRLPTGSTNQQIASALGIALGTVKKHLQRIYAVLGVDNRAAAATAVVRTFA